MESRRGGLRTARGSDGAQTRSGGVMNREQAIRRTFELRAVIFVGVAAAILAGLIVVALFKMLDADSEDRSRIIVRSGSIDFEQDVEWEYESTSIHKKAHANQSNAASVTGFQSTFHKNDIDGTSCPQVALVG